MRARSGIWAGQPNADREYKVDFSGQIIPMGTYHFLGGRRVRIIYNGNTRTCGRCHRTSVDCPGGGIASKCREKNGPQVYIHDHMKEMSLELTRAQLSASQQDQEEEGVSHDQEDPHDGDESLPPNPPDHPAAAQSEGFPPVASKAVDQSQAVIQDLLPTAPVPGDQSQPAPLHTPTELAQLHLSCHIAPSPSTPVPPPAPSTTGTIPKIPGLVQTKSQKKKEKKRKKKAESEAAAPSSDDKLARQMSSWINSVSSSLDTQDNDDENRESDDNDNGDSEQEEKVSAEKDNFDRKVLEQSASKSFFEDNPYLIQETYKSVFANRLSLTPLSRPASPWRSTSSSSTPKRVRSPSPSPVTGIKSIKTDQGLPSQQQQ